MKILIISHEFPPIGGGGANACYFLSKEFKRVGNEVVVLTAHYQNLVYEEILKDGIRIIRVPCMRKNQDKSSFFEMLTYLISAWRKADVLVRKESFDKCLVFFGIPSGPIALYLKKKYGIPYWVRLGGGDVPGTQKRFKYIYKVLAPIVREIWKNAESVIANSIGLKERAQKFEASYPIAVIENGVDDEFFFPKKNSGHNDIELLFVSRLIERKGLQDIIPLLKDIQEKVSEKCSKGIRLIIVGDGPYRKELERLVMDYRVESLVSFEGKKTKQEVRSYYQNADIFILPSKWEGMPNVVLEAMACGLPVIMTPCEGSTELVGDNGIVSDIAQFEKNIEKLCINRMMRVHMGKTSRTMIETKFQWKYIAQKYMRLLCD